MSKFNRGTVRAATGASPIVSEPTPSGTTHEGAPGYAREAKSELFLLAVTNMVGERTFYETADARDTRYEHLVRQLAVADPVWTAGFLAWLRGEANMRSAAIVGAAEFVHARLTAGGDQQPPRRDHTVEGTDSLSYSLASNRRVIESVLQRADEPGELLAYWVSRHGRAIPKPVKRGIADAVQRLYTERALLKYDTASHGFRFGDVLDLVHPSPAADKPWQGPLFSHALNRRHNRPWTPDPEALPMIAFNATLRELGVEDPERHLLDPEKLQRAGMTWEDVLSLAGAKVAKAKLWEALIPSMGYMALLRNLRNFDDAGVSDQVAQTVAAKLADPAEVARSRQLPMRFLSAHRAARSLRWAYPLEQALGHCLAHIPALHGRTLVLVDTPTSMTPVSSKDATLMRWDAAVIFGVALAARCAAADVVSFSSTARMWGDPHGAHTKVFPVQAGESLLRAVERWKSGGWFLGGGTATAAALRKHFAGHDRVVVVTDEQAGVDPTEVTASVPAQVPMYTWNLAGYERGHAPSGSRNRHTFGGLTDQAFRMIPLIEAGRDATWPWQ
ncbi:TROVE domain-containing protein [Micromonospora sp. CPCC 205371]|nr:TROVE domain-containing protein [Micromonospora sp. CPCC 205371]